MMVVRTLTTSTFDLSTTSGLIWEMKDLASSNFHRLNFAYIPRCCNFVSHELATKGSVSGLGTDHIGDTIPNCISQLLVTDLAPVVG